jgi:hypothetical protein
MKKNCSIVFFIKRFVKCLRLNKFFKIVDKFNIFPFKLNNSILQNG